jgi:hypothetical protein
MISLNEIEYEPIARQSAPSFAVKLVRHNVTWKPVQTEPELAPP